MTDIVGEAEELLAGVTPGEWKWVGDGILFSGDGERFGTHNGQKLILSCSINPPTKGDRDFIIAASRLIRSLLQRLRETEEENEKHYTQLEKVRLQRGGIFDELMSMTTERDTLRAENAKLRAAVKGETFCHSDEAANEEMNRLRAERDELREAVVAVAYFRPHMGTAAEMQEIARKALTRAGEE